MNRKKLITWGAVIVGGFVIYKALQSNKNKKLKEGFPYSPNTGGGGININTFNAGPIADEIFEAMDGYGTDENAIVKAFSKIKTDDNFDALVKAYGTRTISSGWGNIFMSDYTGDLSGALHSELSSGWISDINAALQRNGVTKTI